MPCPYEMLGLTPQADPEVVAAAIRVLRLKHHPDKGGSPEAFRKIQAAAQAIAEGRRVAEDPPDVRGLSERLRTIWAPLRRR